MKTGPNRSERSVTSCISVHAADRQSTITQRWWRPPLYLYLALSTPCQLNAHFPCQKTDAAELLFPRNVSKVCEPYLIRAIPKFLRVLHKLSVSQLTAKSVAVASINASGTPTWKQNKVYVTTYTLVLRDERIPVRANASRKGKT